MEVAQRKVGRSTITKLTKTASDLLIQNDEDIDVDEIGVMITRINAANEKLQQANERVLPLIGEKDFENEFQRIAEYDDNVATTIARLEQRIKRLNMGSSLENRSNVGNITDINNTSGEFRRNNNAIKLPKLELKKYNGELEQWPQFWEQFRTSIHENEDFDAITKFNYLQSVLTDKAATTIKGLTPSEACYNDAIELLKNEYGNQQRIIDNYIQKLMTIAPVHGRNDVIGLRKLYNSVSSITRTLKSLGVDENQYGMMVKSVILRSIPHHLRIEFYKQHNNEKSESENEDDQENNKYETKIERLINFVKLELESMELANSAASGSGSSATSGKEKFERKGNYSKNEKEFTAAGLLTKINECLFCKSKSHITADCNGSLNIDQRKDILKRNSRCFRCTKPNHTSKECRNKSIACRKCKGRHVTSMCDPRPKKEDNNDKIEERKGENKREENSTNLLAEESSLNNVLLQTACAYITPRENEDKDAFVRLVIDGGSQLTFIKESLSKMLNLTATGTHKISVIPFGSSRKNPPKQCRRVTFNLISQYDKKLIPINAIEVPEICYDAMKEPTINNPIIQTLNLADKRLGKRELLPGISILIGADYYWELVTGEHIRISNKLSAVNTKLGWTIHGSSPTEYTISANIATVLHEQTEEENDLKRFWDLETIGISNPEAEDTFTDKFIEEKIMFKENRYEVELPWKNPSCNLDNNHEIALSRVKSLTTRLMKSDRLNEYDKAVREYVNSGCAEIARNTNPKKLYYMPHKPVYRQDKTTTKIRVVFDASSHAKGLPSLNQELMQGENLVPDLLRILINFRIGNIAMTADIEKAFLQIRLSEIDRDSHSFLWYETPIENLNNLPNLIRYRMTRVTFGITSSPFLLAATLKKHLTSQMQYEEDFCKKLLNSFYVDDLVITVNSVEEAKTLYQKSRTVMARAGMNLRKWNTNNEELRKHFREEDNEHSTTNTKILGMQWCVLNDEISTELDSVENYSKSTSMITKRTVLQTVSRVYDPLGLLGPFMIRIKILLQTIWKLKLDWDAILPIEQQNEWNEWCQELHVLKEYSIPRSVIRNQTKTELHVFADASMKAYGVTAYLREILPNEEINVNLLMAKNRVAPIREDKGKGGEKVLTLPRLELTAAVCAARLQRYITSNISVQIQTIYLWTDSKIVLHWIAGEPEKWKPYVANRVREIREISKDCVWKHCRGEDNPADLLTRGVKAKVLLNSRVWSNGPWWLSDSSDNWPSESGQLDDVNALEITCAITTDEVSSDTTIFPEDKFEYYEKIMRVTAYAQRYIANLRQKSEKRHGNLTIEELEEAERYWIKKMQEKYFPEEMRRLKKGEFIDHHSTILKLDPFLDKDNLMRLRGRLQETDLPYETKHPIILPKKSQIVKKLIWKIHRSNNHCGVDTTLSELRKRYWVIAGRQNIKSVIRECVICRKLRGKPGSEIFAPLPKDRISQAKPFETTGIDFAGPLYVCDNKNERKKTYIMLFTCAVTRAVHLELVPYMSTESCIKGLRRFIARRGVPAAIYSDNAKTFKRTSLEIQELNMTLLNSEIQNFAQERRIRWVFIVERAPWWGGWWERLVKSVKDGLKLTLGRAVLATEELQTVLTEVEATVNSRPLTYIDDDPTNLLILTPSHFLVGHSNIGLGINVENKEFNRNEILQQWKLREKLMLKFWKKWSSSYLQQLRTAHCIKRAKSTIFKEGEVVLIQEPNAPRLSWKLGRISEVYPGRDGRIRACQIRLSNGTYLKRPVQLLYPLELSAAGGCGKSASTALLERGGTAVGDPEDSSTDRSVEESAALLLVNALK